MGSNPIFFLERRNGKKGVEEKEERQNENSDVENRERNVKDKRDEKIELTKSKYIR